MRLRMFAVIALLLASVFPAAAATSAASIKGVYSFQVIGVTQRYGYYNKNTWVSINGGCPKNTACFNNAFAKLTVGTISFDGKGKAKFLSFKSYGPGNNGGPTVGTLYPYSVAGFFGTLTIPGPHGGTVSLSLGSFNSANVAAVMQFFIPDTQPSIGTAILQ